MERSLILLKPDAVERRLIGRLIARFEDMKMLQVTPELSRQHYAEHVEKPFYGGLESFITSSPVVALVLEGLDVIRVVRDMLGATNGLTAAAGTIRGDFSSSRQMNLVHASDGPEAAAREIDLYFDAAEICGYTPTLVVGRNEEARRGYGNAALKRVPQAEDKIVVSGDFVAIEEARQRSTLQNEFVFSADAERKTTDPL